LDAAWRLVRAAGDRHGQAMTARKIPVDAQNRLLKRLPPMHRDIVLP
jgi:hypothetical protein